MGPVSVTSVSSIHTPSALILGNDLVNFFLCQQLRQISCLTSNFRICELYLNDNELIEIAGSIGHLTCLQLCMLHNNQLTKLDKVTREFKRMQNLHTLSEPDACICGVERRLTDTKMARIMKITSS